MKLIGLSLLAGLGGYILGVLAGLALVQLVSTNTHDRSLEAIMTGVFVTGPLGAVVAFVIGFMLLRRT